MKMGFNLENELAAGYLSDYWNWLLIYVYKKQI